MAAACLWVTAAGMLEYLLRTCQCVLPQVADVDSDGVALWFVRAGALAVS